ncbi:Protoheme IX farnesyltransferase, mitochondrial [Mycena kentingensis (nom. inval.)]|nr:Protoheme IX farnesyltransferase, mitochondrial [Mycena kentingensis (nom. inval.)]
MEHPAQSSPSLIHGLPLAVWAHIALHATRQSIGRLAGASRSLCALFYPILYKDIVNNPPTSAQSVLLIQTLGTAADASASRPHPAPFVRRLALAETLKKDLNDDALKAALASGIAANLHSLHFNISLGVDMLSEAIATGSFSHLKELRVTCVIARVIKSYAFMQLPGLETLGLTLKNSFKRSGSNANYEFLELLAEALEGLPRSSPTIHTLQLRFTFLYDYDALPESEYADLLESINALHLPALKNLDLSVVKSMLPDDMFGGLDDDEHSVDQVQVAGFLNLHPQLRELALNASGTDVAATSVGSLRSFKGPVANCSVVLQHAAGLEELEIVVDHHSAYAFSKFCAANPSLPTIEKLTISAVDANGQSIKDIRELSAKSFTSLIAAFPNLKDLNVHIAVDSRITTFCNILQRAPLLKLECLRIEEYRIRNVPFTREWAKLARALPSEEYTQAMERVLPALPALKHISVGVLVDDDGGLAEYMGCHCRLESWWSSFMRDPAPIRADYDMVVHQKAGKPEIELRPVVFKDTRKKRGQCPGVVPEHESRSTTPFFHRSFTLSRSTIVVRTRNAATSQTRPLLRVYTELAKSRLSLLVVLTAMSGVAVSPLPATVPTLLATAAGTALCSASANTLNQLQEVPFDAQMARTRNRPLVRRAITPLHAMGFAVATGVSGTALLWTAVNPVTAVLGVSNIALYAGLYTWMKRKSIYNTWVGAVVGGIPPLMGWTACGGHLLPSAAYPIHTFLPFDPVNLGLVDNPLGPLALFMLLYSWQFPHFNSLSHLVRDAYAQAGYKMLAVLNPRKNALVSLRHQLLLIPICSILFPLSGVTTWTFAITSLVPNAICTQAAWRFWREGSEKQARVLFRHCLWYLPVVMVLMMVHKQGVDWMQWIGLREEEQKEQN